MNTYDDLYDEAIQWAIEEIINELQHIKTLDDEAIDAIHYAMFKREILDRYDEYIKECQSP